MTALTFFAAPAAAATGKALPVLGITHGLHQGVCLPLDQPVYILGSAANADLLLSDAGIVERHMALRFTDGQVAIEAIGGDVFVCASHAREILIPAGKGHRAHLPVDIRLGEARLTLSRGAVCLEPIAAVAITPSWQRKSRWIIALLLMFLCVGAFAFRGEPVSPLALSTVDKAAALAAHDAPKNTVVQARVWLEQQLATLGLHQIKVSEVDGQLSAHGSYGPTQKGQWLGVQQAFDGRFGQQVMLLSGVVARNEIAKPRVRFQAVWFGDNPYVINDNGERLFPGAVLNDNWLLERIENDEVILARGEERFTLTL
ncbi:FHA domain-containing protein [Pseudomonas hefeiensis]|uniref:FHA domain-containing protein n=1 Tax=Pseudomonas hefeiensis TaxID=2738125 RepID=A0ABY9GGT9_9PSED|nr:MULTISPECIES: FHA domain-containing protein [unclassified Pseudomonas]WLH14884.1 FHA domain-containing protein [Pseudomonas sp. FP205]WLH97933.1 FHA domain-containing protein [Pseudomonas sp. FP53]WLI42208.1 FHA domain-containing protein [Pseudomonas sp. FP821]